MMRRIWAIAVVSLVVMQCAFAGSDLDTIELDLKAHRAPAYSFTQERHIAILAKPVQSSGTVFFSANKGLCWHIEKPYSSWLLVDQSGIAEIDPQGHRNQLMAGGNPVFETFSWVYLALFEGQMARLQQRFVVQPKIEGSNWSLNLLPLPDSPLAWLQQIQLAKSGDSDSLSLVEKNSDHVELRFTALSSDTASGMENRCW